MTPYERGVARAAEQRAAAKVSLTRDVAEAESQPWTRAREVTINRGRWVLARIAEAEAREAAA